MFDSKPITINIPPGPYPACGGPNLDGPPGKLALPCQGTLVPKVGTIDRGTILYWQCSLCGKRV